MFTASLSFLYAQEAENDATEPLADFDQIVFSNGSNEKSSSGSSSSSSSSKSKSSSTKKTVAKKTNSSKKNKTYNNSIAFSVDFNSASMPSFKLFYERYFYFTKEVAFSLHGGFNLNSYTDFERFPADFDEFNLWAGDKTTTITLNCLMLGLPYVYWLSKEFVLISDFFDLGCAINYYPVKQNDFEVGLSLGFENNPYQLKRYGYTKENGEPCFLFNPAFPVKIEATYKQSNFYFSAFAKYSFEPLMTDWGNKDFAEDKSLASEYIINNCYIFGLSVSYRF